MFTRGRRKVAVPEVGAEAPEFNLPSAQGGQLRLSMRTARGPVVVAFYRGVVEEDVEYFKALAAKEDEINLAAGSVVAIGVAEPRRGLNFARACGMKSMVLYDYARVTSRQWGLLEKDKEQGDYARPAVFVVGPDHKVAHAWVGERPEPEEILAKVSEITGLPKPAEEAEREAGGRRRPLAPARLRPGKPHRPTRSRRRCRPRNGRRSRPNAGQQEKPASP